MVTISRNDGVCRECSGTLTVIDADDVSMQVTCDTCGDEYTVEIDAFPDGGCEYWPQIMSELEGSR